MLLDERRQRILDLVTEQGFVSLQDLVRSAGASESTVRRDLDFLDEAGRLRRTRGGAAALVGQVAAPGSGTPRNVSATKATIARVAARLVQDGETVLIDGGSTTHALARELVTRDFSSLQVVTNSIGLLDTLGEADGIELVCLGGVLQAKTGVLLGPLTTAALGELHVRKLIMGAGGIQETGLYNSNSLLVETERRMIEAADEVIVVAESSKFGHSELVHLCSLGRVDCLVTDSGLTPFWRTRLETAGVRTIVADSLSGEARIVSPYSSQSPRDAGWAVPEGNGVMSTDDQSARSANFQPTYESKAALPTA